MSDSLGDLGRQLLDEERALLEAHIDNLADAGDAVRQQAVQALDLSAAILAAQMRGEDTAVAEQSLVVIRRNITAASSVAVGANVSAFIQKSMVGIAARIGVLLLTA